MRRTSIYLTAGWLLAVAGVVYGSHDGDPEVVCLLLGGAFLCAPLHMWRTRRLREKPWEVLGGLIVGVSLLAYAGHDPRALLRGLGPEGVGALVTLAIAVVANRMMMRNPRRRNRGQFMGQRQHDRHDGG